MKNLFIISALALTPFIYSGVAAQSDTANAAGQSKTKSGAASQKQSGEKKSSKNASHAKSKKDSSTPPVNNKIAVSDPGMPADKPSSTSKREVKNADSKSTGGKKPLSEISPK